MIHPREVSIAVFVATMVIIILIKPRWLVNDSGQFKPFGFGKDQTPFNITVIAILLAVLSFMLSYFFFNVIAIKSVPVTTTTPIAPVAVAPIETQPSLKFETIPAPNAGAPPLETSTRLDFGSLIR